MSDGNWQITAFCCANALCWRCQARGTVSELGKRERLPVITGFDQAYCLRAAAMFSTLEPSVEPLGGWHEAGAA